MVKVQLPTVEEETRSKLNQVKARRNDKTIGNTLEYLVDVENKYTTMMNQMNVMEKERDLMKDINDLITEPIKHHMMESTPEEIDSLELSGEFNKELEMRIKTFWKRFAKKD